MKKKIGKLRYSILTITEPPFFDLVEYRLVDNKTNIIVAKSDHSYELLEDMRSKLESKNGKYLSEEV